MLSNYVINSNLKSLLNLPSQYGAQKENRTKKRKNEKKNRVSPTKRHYENTLRSRRKEKEKKTKKRKNMGVTTKKKKNVIARSLIT